MKHHQKGQEVEWSKAQKIAVSVDLIPAAKQLLQFLAAIDRNRHLYQGPTLDHAIHRHVTRQIANTAMGEFLTTSTLCPPSKALVLNKQKKFGQGCIQMNHFNLAASALRAMKLTNKLMPKIAQTMILYQLSKGRPLSFTRPFIGNDIFLKEAVAQYKGFLHLIKRNKEKSIRQLCVPTYDIDLMWYAHQLHPALYCKDITAIFGMVLEHDDTNPDRIEGNKLDVGFMETTKQWEEVYGLRILFAEKCRRHEKGLEEKTIEPNRVPTQRTQLHSRFGQLVLGGKPARLQTV
ncbi:hypothetical protein Cgig2_022679 [Carnegiea gigantea]|uniref:Uncharacterized protein n=1 Tax=Carnegiea gigantea TaxID=171969 RepID=A0A9Q1KBU5_9CARY|nr:hypothetical protein Cgig2_022679 [Carnegiea gigantea]